MYGIDNIHRIKLYRTQIKIVCVRTFETDKFASSLLRGRSYIYRQAVYATSEHSVQVRGVTGIIYLHCILVFTGNEGIF